MATIFALPPGVGLITGGAGNDTFIGGQGVTIDGGAGIDTVIYSANHASYLVTPTATGYSTAGFGHTETLINIERLHFSDTTLALDMNASQSGGEAALLIGAVLGNSSLQNRSLVGQLLQFFDAGKTLHDAATVLVNAGIMDQLAGGSSTSAYVNLIYHAVTGLTATPDMNSQLAAYIDTGVLTRIDFLTVAAELPINQSNVDLVGLQRTGLESLP
ncbi:MAG: hypothetical protein WCJ76_00005 [Comamonadaceae bacterium]